MNEALNTGIEQEIAHLEKQLAEKRAALSTGSQEKMSTDRELVHAEVGKRIQEHAPSYQPPAPSLPTNSAQVQSEVAPDKIQELINIVFEKDLKSAVQAAQEMDNPAALDAFHDLLTSQLYQTLVERGKIENN